MSSGLQCNSKFPIRHFVCVQDFESYVRFSSAEDTDISSLRRRQAKILCPMNSTGGAAAAPACDSQPFTEAAIARHVSEDTFSLYFASAARLSAQDAFEQSQHAIQAEVQRILRGIRQGTLRYSDDLLVEQLRRLIPDPRQCAQCGYGPVDPYACSDLTAHHGEAVPAASGSGGGGTRIDNACPECGWFSSSLDAWPRWGGSLPESFTRSSPAAVVAVPNGAPPMQQQVLRTHVPS